MFGWIIPDTERILLTEVLCNGEYDCFLFEGDSTSCHTERTVSFCSFMFFLKGMILPTICLGRVLRVFGFSLNYYVSNVSYAGFDSKIMKNCGKIKLKKTKLSHLMDHLVLLVRLHPRTEIIM